MKFKKLAAVLAAATMLSTGVVPVMAAETVSVEPTAHQVMEIQEAIESDVKIQSEVRAANDTKAAIEDEFDLGTLGKDGVYTSGTAKVSAHHSYRADNEGISMSDGGIVQNSDISNVTVNNDGTITLMIETQSISYTFMGITASGTLSGATVHYYLNGEEKAAAASADGNVLTVTLENGAQGMQFEDGSTDNAGSMDNMLLIEFATNITGLPNWIISLLPDAMKNPTAYYGFNVAD